MIFFCRLRLHCWLYESPTCNCRRCTQCGKRQTDRMESAELSPIVFGEPK